MSIDKSNDDNVQDRTEAYYEELASQEEINLEEREERAREVLISESPSPSGGKQLTINRESPRAQGCLTDANNNPRTVAGLDEQRNHAAEELITGDPDDPPLSEETVVEVLRTRRPL